ncbi:MAG: cell division protein FtsQ/DivIB [Candidatus Liberibacter ctenarytainae]|uniref:Cell division protein FtsQ n=1 Tax=Candidatus Liberibacter ctenarytainae TaxID=2020335 RepID=A0A937AKH8_9HYPH|nr:cell division protein FtsQ/DivIB [Candidatus Liberibacter ctenarytainae]
MSALSRRDYFTIDQAFLFSVGMSLSIGCYSGLGDMKTFLNFCFFLEKMFPPYCGVIATILFFLVVGISGLFIGGKTHSVLDSIPGFSIKNIRIIGNAKTSEKDIFHRLDLNKDTSLIIFDAIQVQKKLLQLPWIAQAEIRKVYPDTIEIRLKECSPYAIWQHNANFFLIDQNGKIIDLARNEQFAHLPTLIGLGANKEIQSFEQIMAFSEIAKRVKAYSWIAGRRWDLHLKNGIIVNLPEEKFRIALFKILDLQDKYHILERDISVIDMRIPDRITIRLTTGSFIDRREIIDWRTKALIRGSQ